MTNTNQSYDPTRDPTPAHIRAERRRMITPAFWSSLLKGGEPLGETFWAGNLLSALLVAPVLFVILVTLGPLAPSVAAVAVAVVGGAFGLFLLGVARAVAVAQPRPEAKAPIALRILGVIVTLASAVNAVWLTVVPVLS